METQNPSLESNLEASRRRTGTADDASRPKRWPWLLDSSQSRGSANRGGVRTPLPCPVRPGPATTSATAASQPLAVVSRRRMRRPYSAMNVDVKPTARLHRHTRISRSSLPCARSARTAAPIRRASGEGWQRAKVSPVHLAWTRRTHNRPLWGQ